MKIIKLVQPNCGQCRMVDSLLIHLGLNVDATRDIFSDDEAYQLAVENGVKSTPTLLLLDNDGTVVDRVSGVNQEATKALFAKRV